MYGKYFCPKFFFFFLRRTYSGTFETAAKARTYNSVFETATKAYNKKLPILALWNRHYNLYLKEKKKNPIIAV